MDSETFCLACMEEGESEERTKGDVLNPFVLGVSNNGDHKRGKDMSIKCGVILAVIGYIVFFFCMEGWGADWKLIGQDVEGSVLEIDVASISRQPNNIVRVLVKQTRSKESVTGWVNKFGEEYKDFSHSIDLEEYHCTEKKRRILSLTQYSLGGGIIFSDNSPGEWSFIIPDSTADAVFEEVCK